MNTDNFYAGLSAFTDFRDFTKLNWYTPLPADWLIIITDVQNSTRAILDGKYKDVNALGAASIVGLLNAIKPLKIPYIFGGDGATLCVPASYRAAAEAALAGTRVMAEAGFGLILRTGIVDMPTLHAAGQPVLVGKFRPAPRYEQAMFKGSGLAYAETLVKDPAPGNRYRLEEDHPAPKVDFSGFECRWNEVPSPRGETVSLLVKALEKDQAADAMYTAILENIVAIYGSEANHHPLRVEQLSLTLSPAKLSTEARIKSADASFWRRWAGIAKLLVYVLAGKWFFYKKVKTDTADWANYRQTLIRNTDYRKFDGALRMVISGTAQQREQLRRALDERRRLGQIVYGLHADPSALITCIISNHADDHVHFLDGSNGGYTLAAEEMKKQLR